VDYIIANNYPLLVTDAVRTDLKNYTQDLIDTIKLIKAKQDYTSSETKIREQIKNIAVQLHGVNRFNWPEQLLIDLFNGFTNSVLDQARARVSKDWSKDLYSANSMDKAISTGLDSGAPSLSDVLSKGIIISFQSKFH